MFLTYCNFQPLPLFHHETFLESYESRDIEVQLVVQALGQRFQDSDVGDQQINRQIQDWTDASRRIVMSRVAEGTVELSTLQAMCLLIVTDYTSEYIGQ